MSLNEKAALVTPAAGKGSNSCGWTTSDRVCLLEPPGPGGRMDEEEVDEEEEVGDSSSPSLETAASTPVAIGT